MRSICRCGGNRRKKGQGDLGIMYLNVENGTKFDNNRIPCGEGKSESNGQRPTQIDKCIHMYITQTAHEYRAKGINKEEKKNIDLPT